MKDFFDLKRTIHSAHPAPSADDIPWADCLAKYACNSIQQLTKDCYSKLEAIENVRTSARLPYDSGQMQEMLRALLTDHGLLFPQTRERHERSVTRSMKWSQNRPSLERTTIVFEFDRSATPLNRFYAYAKEINNVWYRDQSSPISLEKVRAAISKLFASQDFSLSSFQLIHDDVGYYKSELGRLSSEASPEDAEQIMQAWLDTVFFQFGSADTIRADGFFNQPADLTGNELNLKTAELFEFLSSILPKCMEIEDKFRRSLEPSDYTPVLAATHQSAFLHQVDRFNQEDLSTWRTALPALREYLWPDIERYPQRCFANREYVGANKSKLTKGMFKSFILDDGPIPELEDAFRQYLGRMEPTANHRKSANRDDSTVSGLSGFFAAYSDKEAGSPFFLDQPMVIFQIFRSPVHRYLYQREDRCWSIRRIVDDACIRLPLPITVRSLQADTALYEAVVNFCHKSCEMLEVGFCREPWDALWTCICQSVQCLNFQIEDLFSVQYQFRGMMKFRDKGFPILDQWFVQTLSERASPEYIVLWRSLVNKLCSPSRGQNTVLSDAVSSYRQYFRSPVSDEEDVWRCLSPLCTAIRWNYIKAVPSEQAFMALAKEANVSIPIRARKGPYSTACTCKMVKSIGHKRYKVEPVRAMELFHMEWLLLQCVCDQARRELMEAVYLYLSNAKKPPV